MSTAMKLSRVVLTFDGKEIPLKNGTFSYRPKEKAGSHYRLADAGSFRATIETSAVMPLGLSNIVGFGVAPSDHFDLMSFGSIMPTEEHGAVLHLLRERLAAIDLHGFRMPIRLGASAWSTSRGEAVFAIDISIGVFERDARVHAEITVRRGINAALLQDETAFYAVVRDMIVDVALRHELDEQFLVRGKRIFDPHPAPMPFQYPPPPQLRESDAFEEAAESNRRTRRYGGLP